MKKVIFTLFVTLFIISCSTKTKEVEKQDNIKEVVVKKKKDFIVKMNFKTNKEDSFILMMNRINVHEFQRKSIHIIEKVAPSTNFDNLVANFSDNKLGQLKINFGNSEVKEVEIELIDISYGDKNLKITGNELSEYFNVNKFIELKGNKLETKKVDGKHNPSIIFKNEKIKIFDLK